MDVLSEADELRLMGCSEDHGPQTRLSCVYKLLRLKEPNTEVKMRKSLVTVSQSVTVCLPAMSRCSRPLYGTDLPMLVLSSGEPPQNAPSSKFCVMKLAVFQRPWCHLGFYLGCLTVPEQICIVRKYFWHVSVPWSSAEDQQTGRLLKGTKNSCWHRSPKTFCPSFFQNTSSLSECS